MSWTRARGSSRPRTWWRCWKPWSAAGQWTRKKWRRSPGGSTDLMEAAMPRLMCVSLTEPQVRARSKTVTRRDGWWEDKNGKRMLKPGDRLTLVRKAMGLRKGEHVEHITDVEVVSVRREPLHAITKAEVALEGFAHMTPAGFVAFFCDSHKGCTPE